MAERLIAIVLALDIPLGEMDAIISQMPDGNERQAFIRSLGNIFRAFNEGFVLPITTEYPDLAPEN